MAEIKYLEEDVYKDIVAKGHKMGRINLHNPCMFVITQEIDAGLKSQLVDNQPFNAAVAEARQKYYKNGLIGQVIQILAKGEQEVPTLQDGDREGVKKLVSGVIGAIEAAFADTKEKFLTDVNKAAAAHVAAYKTIKDFKRQQKVKFGIGVLGTIGSASSLIVSGAMIPISAGVSGAGVALSAWSLVKNAKNTRNEWKSLKADIDKLGQELHEEITALNDKYLIKDLKKRKIASKELAATAASSFAAMDVNSITNIRKKIELYVGKNNELYKKQEQIASAIVDLTEKQAEMEKLVKQAMIDCETVAQALQKSNLTAEMKSNLQVYSDMITKTGKLLEDYKKTEQDRAAHRHNIDAWEDILADLKNKKPGWVKYAQKAIIVAELVPNVATTAVTGGVSGAPDVADLLFNVADIVNKGNELTVGKKK